MPLVKPVFEARSDLWVHRELASRIGLDPDEIFPVLDKVNFFDTYINMEYLDTDGVTWKKAFTWTAENAAEYGVDNAPQEGTMPFSEFVSRGSFMIPRSPGDGNSFIGRKAFVENPEANPLVSLSGKLELYCQLKADNYNIMGINPVPIKPYANYFVPVDGYEATFSDWKNKVKSEYPLQLYNIHYLRRAHTCYDNMQWLQEAFVNPVFINASDGRQRGIQDGDTVVVQSRYGKTLRRAQLMEGMMPGTVALPHGPHSDLDESNPDDIIDRGGNEQILYGPVHSNYYPHLNGYNSVLVEVAKYAGEPIPWDYERGPFLDGAGV
jgi:anaerobic dimethyl sulfoxide reductase subunit A